MELYKEMLCNILETEEFEIFLPKWDKKLEEVMEQKSFLALQAIKRILEEDAWDDAECFARIEKIIAVFEEMGSGIRNRHDF